MYRCSNKTKCNASISLLTGFIDGVNSVIEPFKLMQSNPNHHETCELLTQGSVAERTFLDGVKKLIVDQPNRPIQQVYKEAQARYLSSEDSEVESLKDFVQVKHVLKYARAKNNPALAKTIEELDILERRKFIDRGQGVKEKFLILDNQKPKSILLFCSEIGLRILSKSKKLHGDGTFFCAARFFAKLSHPCVLSAQAV